MKLGIGTDRIAPSKVVSAFMMLPPTCGVKTPSNLQLSILSANNYWLQSMWLECSTNAGAENEAVFTVKDCVFGGGISKETTDRTGRYFKLDIEKRMTDIIALSDITDTFSEDTTRIIKLFADIYLGHRAYNPDHYADIRFTNPDVIQENEVDPETIYEVIQADAHLAKQMGTYLFGFTVAGTPRDCPPQTPFKFNAIFSGGAFGVLRGEEGCKISLPYHEPGVALCEDYYLILINAFFHRFCLVDLRFLENSTTFRNTGGLSEYRSTEGEKEAYLYLKKKFGNAIQRKPQGYTNEGKPRKSSSPYERVLNIPF